LWTAMTSKGTVHKAPDTLYPTKLLYCLCKDNEAAIR
jgi:hypothetical protein